MSSLRILARGACLGALALACAPVVSSSTAAPADVLGSAVEDVTGSTHHRYDARDDRGVPLDGLKAIEAGGRYVGVHHAVVRGRFETRVATSSDLMSWTYVATLEADAAQPTISAVSGGGYVVAYEKGRRALLSLPPELDRLLGIVPPLQRLGRATVRLRFRYYRSLDRLLRASHERQFTAPLTLSPTAEGTPSIARADFSGGPARSRIEVGLHYFADENGDTYPDVDRQGTGVLSGFAHWSARRAPALDGAFRGLQQFHAPFGAAPRGNIGDRDHVVVDGSRLDLHEAQYLPGDFGSWRIFLRDPATGGTRPLELTTDGGSAAFGNPTATSLRSPSGRPALLVTAFVFGEGAAAGEAGPLVYYRER